MKNYFFKFIFYKNLYTCTATKTQNNAKAVKKAAYSVNIMNPVTYAKLDGKQHQITTESLDL
jgi:hypothetical protein